MVSSANQKHLRYRVVLNCASGFYISKALRFLSSSFSRLADIPRALESRDLAALSNLAIKMLRAIPPRSYVAESFRELLACQ